MRKLLTAGMVLTAFTLLAGGTQMRAQFNDKSTLQPEPAAERSDKPAQNVVLGGRLNDTGDIFVPDSDLHAWKVNNPKSAAVKKHRNEHVTINALQDFRSGSLTVQSAQSVDRTFSTNPSRH